MELYKGVIGWLFGGNYTAEQTEEFRELFVKFANQCYLEKEKLMDVFKQILKEKGPWDEEETLDWIAEVYSEWESA